MDKVITTALLTIAAVIASVMVVNTMVPALGRGSSSVVGSSAVSAEQIKTNVELLTVTAIATEIYVWVKNVGAVEILSIDDSDVFLEDVGAASFDRMPYEAPSPQMIRVQMRQPTATGGTVSKRERRPGNRATPCRSRLSGRLPRRVSTWSGLLQAMASRSKRPSACSERWIRTAIEDHQHVSPALL